MKLFIESTLNEQLNQLCKTLNQRFGAEAIKPPAELLTYLAGKKFESEEKSRRVQEIYNDWMPTVDRAVRMGTVTLKEILNVLPEPFKTDVIEALTKLIAKDKAT